MNKFVLFEVDGLVTKYEGWEFLGLVKDDENAARGIVAQNLTTSEIKSFGSDAVIMTSGGRVLFLVKQRIQ